MSKLDDALALLRMPGGEGRNNNEIAAEVGCSEAHIRRAREVLRAERLAAQEAEEGSEAEQALAAILRASRAEGIIEDQIADLKDDLKTLKAALKDMRGKTRDAVAAALETYPLFDRGSQGGSDVDGDEGGETEEEGSKGLALASVG
jgi:hypothetical protein